MGYDYRTQELADAVADELEYRRYGFPLGAYLLGGIFTLVAGAAVLVAAAAGAAILIVFSPLMVPTTLVETLANLTAPWVPLAVLVPAFALFYWRRSRQWVTGKADHTERIGWRRLCLNIVFAQVPTVSILWPMYSAGIESGAEMLYDAVPVTLGWVLVPLCALALALYINAFEPWRALHPKRIEQRQLRREARQERRAAKKTQREERKTLRLEKKSRTS